MTSIAYFSTDFTQEPVVDEAASALAGKQVFVEGQMRLTFGGTFYNRGAMPGMELNKHGYDNHLAWRFTQHPDGHISTVDMHGEWHDPDVFYSQRWMHKDGPEQIRRARAAGQICIADLDDQFWNLPKSNIAYQTTDPVAHPDFNRDHYRKMLAECDFVTTSTEPLRKEMERLGVPTFTVRNCIDMERWPANNPTGPMVTGWIGGIQWRANDIHILKAVDINQFLADHQVPIFHGGDSQVPGVPKFWEQAGIDVAKVGVASAPLCHIAQYPQLWEPLNVSLIPLERVAFNECKSWLKQLESCAAGIPYIVSAGFAEQNALVGEGTAGRVAKNEKPSDWHRHLSDLLDPDVRAEEGAKNRAVALNHDIKDRWEDWHNVYKEFF